MIRVFFFRIILLTTCLTYSLTNIEAQELYRHSNNISGLELDSLGQIVFIDSNERLFFRDKDGIINELEGLEFLDSFPTVADIIFGENWPSAKAFIDGGFKSLDKEKYNITDYQVYWKCPVKKKVEIKKELFDGSYYWAITDSSLIRDCLDDHYVFSFILNDLAVFDGSILLASGETGLWIKQGENFRRLYYPGINFPVDIEKIIQQGDILWILRMNGSLLAFDRHKILLTGIAEDVDDFVIDKWNVISYIKGKSIFRETAFHNSNPADLIIDELMINGIKHPFAASIEASQSEKVQLKINKHHTPSVPGHLMQYKLGESEWIEFENRITINLDRPGFSSLLIRSGTSESGFLNHYKIPVHVKQKIGLSYWPYLLAIMALLFLLAGIAYLRSISSNKKLKDRRRQLEQKLNLLEAEQRLKQAQMNPHLLFNALNALKGLVVTGEKVKAATGIDNFAKLMRALLDDLDKERISISEEIDFLEAYIKLEKAIRPFQFDYKITNSVGDKFIAPLMVQPFVENAVIHGLANVSSDAFLKIDFTEEKFYIKVTIENSGRGNQKNKIINPPSHRSRALDIYIERCSKLDKWKKKEALIYEEISDEQNGLSGMRCILHIPKL